MASILCIDDDPRMLQLLKSVLENEGYAVVTAADGPTGISMARTLPIGLVILDFHMPVINGGEVAALLKRELPSLPIVIYSGCPDAVPEPMRVFANAVLCKGDGPNALLCMVEGFLGAPAQEGKRAAITIPEAEDVSATEQLPTRASPQIQSRFLLALIESNSFVRAVCHFCFHTNWPRHGEEAGQQQELNQVPAPKQAQIFVVDDDVVSANSISLVLRNAGFAVSTFYDPLQAAQRALLSVPDVVVIASTILLDCVVFAAWLGENCPRCNVVILSKNAEADAGQRWEGLKLTLLQKPLLPEKLISAVQRVS